MLGPNKKRGRMGVHSPPHTVLKRTRRTAHKQRVFRLQLNLTQESERGTLEAVWDPQCAFCREAISMVRQVFCSLSVRSTPVWNEGPESS